jgi:hypothetical protein
MIFRNNISEESSGMPTYVDDPLKIPVVTKFWFHQGILIEKLSTDQDIFLEQQLGFHAQ